MDVDFLKSATEEQTMEMMMMMMQMEKLPTDYPGPHHQHEGTDSQSMEFSGSSIDSLTHHSYDDNPHQSSSLALVNHHHHHANPSTLSFIGNNSSVHHQEQVNMSSAMVAGNNKYSSGHHAGELSGANANGAFSNKRSSMAAMREMIFRIAAMQPIHIDPESVKPPKRKNVKISKDPQSVAARHRRERISERIRILQRLVPGGTKMDTASMLDEAIHYMKFLKTQVQSLEKVATNNINTSTGTTGSPPLGFGANYSSLAKAYQYLPTQHQIMFNPNNTHHQMLN
ncbi:hypothetical protein C5167_011002 [Papaver somniferum]|uniref:BHLH domain-containing protein n=1 Tax=Papaver somniferum TaxID=3469 RepID=A0A4Y7K525_PAPSO|nr:transcription factor HEC2-like [Papaver somniferum]RZC67311.1 hypothetical protein C5167_011002 [Papaver somniferum]